MKRILSILLTICLLASALSVTAFADAPAVLRVSALKKGEGIPVVISEYTSFEDGWNDAMELAGDMDEMRKKGYDRIVVDLHTKWSADEDGEFTDDIWNGPGFDNDTIYIPENARVTLNLNGHTIDRHLTDDEDDGEVIFINDDADVIINDGTITGGYSNSEGGGLYIEGGAKVTLNNVNVIGNSVVGDDGAGIYLYGDATLIMNGGSLSNNSLDEKHIGLDIIEPFGTLCAMDSTVILNNVTIDGNYTHSSQAEGVILYAKRSVVKMNQCTVSNNLTKKAAASHAIYVEDSSLTITNTSFTNNNLLSIPSNHTMAPRLFRVIDSNLIVTGGTMTKNGGSDIFYLSDSEADITNVTITDNGCGVIDLRNSDKMVNMIGCTFGNNTPFRSDSTFYVKRPDTLALQDCTLGDSTFSNPEYVKITTSEVTREEAVIGIELLREDGTVESVRYYKDFASGWNYAAACAEANFVGRITVDLYADWNTNSYGAVTVPENARMTLNLNGHTINRGLTEVKTNGEVIYIKENADVVINTGTITGGYSFTGAGGIHIKDKAKVLLTDVNVKDNKADGSNGAAIAVYNGAVLVVNGGSISDNLVTSGDSVLSSFISISPYGTLYVNDATATLNNVTISNNDTGIRGPEGVAICADGSTVTLNDCVVSGNATGKNKGEVGKNSASVMAAYASKLTVNNTDFTGNGNVSSPDDFSYSRLFYLDDSELTMTGGKITGNASDKLFCIEDSMADIKGVTITDNASIILDIDNSSAKVTLTECTLGDNEPVKEEFDVIVDTAGTLVLTNCDLGDTTFKDKTMVAGAGSIFGEGSLTMIVAALALVASAVSIFLIVDMKKKLIPAAAGNTAEGEDKE